MRPLDSQRLSHWRWRHMNDRRDGGPPPDDLELCDEDRLECGTAADGTRFAHGCLERSLLRWETLQYSTPSDSQIRWPHVPWKKRYRSSPELAWNGICVKHHEMHWFLRKFHFKSFHFERSKIDTKMQTARSWACSLCPQRARLRTSGPTMARRGLDVTEVQGPGGGIAERLIELPVEAGGGG